jgi:phosphoenolpyruvate-protein phosphotransferase
VEAVSLGEGIAWRAAIKAQVDVLAAAKDPRVAERVVDLRDLELRLLAALTGEPRVSLDIPEGSILLAHDLLPSQVAALDPMKVAGIALAEGGPTSHAAILAAGSGIPMAVAFGTALDTIGERAMLLLDADRGALEVDPPEARIAQVEAALHEREAAAKALATGACRAAEGERIEIFANLGSLADAEAAVAAGAEGCGLLRTEFLFLDRSEPPSEEEQRAAYQAIADALGDRPLIVRLLDIGGDKPAPYLSIPPEENPVLGLRGIRVGLARPEVLETQLRAILSVQPPGRCRIMPPMIASVAELEAVADAVERIEREIGLNAATKVGAMIETPAAALTSDILSSRAAFLSIGTNDLAQYALAMDRGNAAVTAGIDGLHPAVLRLIAAACEGAGTHGVPVGVCGGLAADRLAVPILLGLGATELSVPPARVAATRAQVAGLSLARCRTLAAEALGLESAAAVRARAAMFLEGEQQ